ncbi:MAG TPA: ABC transporter substrate-binding protein [Dehalococcoidia bacterium]|nr:ABC transporter substrate-binding protein [Dehalococcoidia bacterium]
MEDNSSWKKFLDQRVTRRRMLQGSALGAAGLAAAAVFGCGDDEETTGGTPTGSPRARGGSYPDQGISDTEVKIGGTWPLTGPILPSTAIADAPKAYFEFLNNTQGGVDGRKINYIFYDDTYNPASTREQTIRLLNQDRVFALCAGLGTAQQNAVIQLAEQGKVPHLFISTTSSIFLDPDKHPWTTTSLSLAPYYGYGAVFGDYISRELRSAKVAILFQNDDLGKDYVAGLKSTLKSPASLVSEQSYEVTDQDLSSQVLAMRNSGADTLVLASVFRPNVSALRAAAGLNWRPQLFLSHAVVSLAGIISANLQGLYEGAIGFFAAKDPLDPTFANDPAIRDADRVVSQFAPNINKQDASWATGQIWAHAFVDCLKRMKGNSRQDLMDAVRSLKDFEAGGLLLPGVVANGSKTTNAMMTKGKLGRFRTNHFEVFGQVVDAPLPPKA